MKILPAALNDAEKILALQKQAYQQEAEIYQDFSIPPLTQTQEEIEKEFESSQFLIAVKEGQILGSVRAIQDGTTCLIGRLVVQPSYQGHGIGTKLLTALEEEFKQCKRYELFTGAKSHDNIRLYRKLGYLPYKQKTIHPGLSLVYLEKINSNRL